MKNKLIIAIAAIFLFGAYLMFRPRAILIPTCSTANLVVEKGCTARAWGNGVEVDCPDGAKIYHCDTLKAASPK